MDINCGGGFVDAYWFVQESWCDQGARCFGVEPAPGQPPEWWTVSRPAECGGV